MGCHGSERRGWHRQCDRPALSQSHMLLNNHLRCRAKSRDMTCRITRVDGTDPEEAILEELPRHAVFEIGDTIVTSASLPYSRRSAHRTIVKGLRDHERTSFALRVRLFTGLHTLGTVRIIADSMTDEIREVERDIIDKK
ncbi:hypothetical protein [Paramuribaculum intestinale]|uniref:hypothetical protein n=1 Tax=Paramuribaculum intestinale TaxID=2094151 RepID=UPI003F694298